LSGTTELEFKRLRKTLLQGPKFQFVFVGIEHGDLLHASMDRINGVLVESGMPEPSIRTIRPSATSHPQIALLRDELVTLNRDGAEVIHLVPNPDWVTPAMCAALNIYREGIAHPLTCRLVFWLTEGEITTLSKFAIDLWSWRSGVFRMYDLDE
jgi:hypothetical protein